MNSHFLSDKKIIDLLKPETDLERFLVDHPLVRKGLLWGEPRYGHPEGKVLYHIPEIFKNINQIFPRPTKSECEKLRIIALLHDSFKYAEDKNDPRDWTRHHSILARQFGETFIKDNAILDIIELHDEAYYCWRLEVLEDEHALSAARFKSLQKRINHCLQLYYMFFKCDTQTGDKTQAPVKWFERKGLNIEKISFTENSL